MIYIGIDNVIKNVEVNFDVDIAYLQQCYEVGSWLAKFLRKPVKCD